MPAHDWTRVDSNLYHHFHQMWSAQMTNTLNAILKPKGYFALVEQHTGTPAPDVIALKTDFDSEDDETGDVAVAARPKTRLVQQLESNAEKDARRANRISIRHSLGKVVAIIEIVSPGNKNSRRAIRSFVGKTVEFLEEGIHLLVIDLFPPSIRDPQGIHAVITEALGDTPLAMPEGKPLTLVSYEAADPVTAYIEPFAVGDVLPDMPLFLRSQEHIFVPLEASYQATWEMLPEPFRDAVQPSAS
ncbi:DUF4058 family protein [Zavarzinella formosa]|uniref:DUF4058 family protein n=1 Tax=Zavarzinella formosa TaxID=360055 RepID=UPI0002EA0B1C|nr:DUF4058 family protein [Zavarzinella formosa]